MLSPSWMMNQNPFTLRGAQVFAPLRGDVVEGVEELDLWHCGLSECCHAGPPYRSDVPIGPPTIATLQFCASASRPGSSRRSAIMSS
jgi:hypothetical protein